MDEEEYNTAARALDKERVKDAARLPEAAEGAELNARDTKERQDDEREEDAQRLAEAEEILENAERQHSKEELGEMVVADKLAET